MKRHILTVVLLVILGYWSVAILATDGYFPMHDDTQVGRVVAMGKALRNGQFPVRWVSDLGYGYGYPIFNFYGPLPYYFGGLLYALGVPALTATKIMFGTGLILSAITMYALMSLWGKLAGLVGGVFYLYAPYHAVDVYVRGAVGEYWAMAFLPLVLLGGILFFRRRWKAGVTVGAMGIAGVVLSHTILGYITVAACIAGLGLWIFPAVRSKKIRTSVLLPLVMIAAGLGLSAFFWMPALFEMHFTSVTGQVGGSADFRFHFVCIEQLWESGWGFGGSAPGCADGMSYRLGKLHVIVALISLVILMIRGKKSGKAGLIFVVITLSSLFFLLPVSSVLWERLPFFSFVQYPWRFLTFTILGISAFVAMGVGKIPNQPVRGAVTFLLVIAALMVYPKLFRPQYTYAKPSAAFETDEELKFRVSSISDEYLPPDIRRPQDAFGIVHDTIHGSEGLIANTERDTETYARFALRADTVTKVRIDRAYFPGWVYIVNGQRVIPEIRDGLPYITVPAEPTIAEIQFRNTPVRLLGNSISAITLIVFILLYGKKTIG